MALFYAYNSALSATTAIAAGTSYVAATARVALQLGIPSGGRIKLIEWGISFDGSTAATPALVEVASTATASTMSSAHTTTTVECLDDSTYPDSRLTMGTGATGYGNGAITSNTTLRMADRQYIAPSNQYIKQWPLGREPGFGASGAAQYLQFRINTTATVNAIVYAIWEESI